MTPFNESLCGLISNVNHQLTQCSEKLFADLAEDPSLLKGRELTVVEKRNLLNAMMDVQVAAAHISRALVDVDFAKNLILFEHFFLGLERLNVAAAQVGAHKKAYSAFQNSLIQCRIEAAGIPVPPL